MSMFGSKGYTVEEAMEEKVHSLPARTPEAKPPSLDNIAELVGRGHQSLVEEHQSLLTQAKSLSLQIDACLASAQEARNAMDAAREDFCKPEEKAGDDL